MSKTILIIDDEYIIRWILKGSLGKNDLTIMDASSGAEGIELAKQLSPDLIIMDYKMPDMNGWQATSKIKEFLPNVIVIGHTGYANDKSREEGIKLGCTEILQKPVDLDIWNKIISKYLA